MARESRVRQWMSSPAITVSPQASLYDAHNLMMERDVRRLLAVDASGSLVGIVTASDIQRLRPIGRDGMEDRAADILLMDRTVAEVMAWDPVTVQADDRIQLAAEAMIEAGVSGLPVLDGDQVAGIITESDIFRLVVEAWGRETGA